MKSFRFSSIELTYLIVSKYSIFSAHRPVVVAFEHAQCDVWMKME